MNEETGSLADIDWAIDEDGSFLDLIPIKERLCNNAFKEYFMPFCEGNAREGFQTCQGCSDMVKARNITKEQ